VFSLRKKTELTDDELLARYRLCRDSEYFGKLFSRYIPMLYGIGLKYIGEPAKAEDAVMDLFELLLPKIEQYEIREFRAWIYSVMKNHCLQILRKEKYEISVDFNSEIMESDEILNLFEEAEESDERQAALKRCISRLPVEQRISILRFFTENMSYQDIADTASYTLKQVKSYIHNGKRNLKICIEKNSR